MEKAEIHLNDWKRILFGDAPGFFLVEVLYRTILIYIILLVILRLMGKRMGGQLTISELAVMLTLGAIISSVMQTPDKSLLEGVTVLLCALLFQRGLNYLGIRSAKAEHFIQGEESMLLRDGHLILSEMNRANISRQQLYSVLRCMGIYNLGGIERIYLEASGLFSVYKLKDPEPGLSILPVGEKPDLENFDPNTTCVCAACGAKQQHQAKACYNCGAQAFQPAVIYHLQA